MRNSTIAIFLAALAGNACAGWTVTAKDDTQTAYADIDNIRHIGSTARMWTMMDFATPKSLPGLPKYVSTVRLQEFDCIACRHRPTGLLPRDQRRSPWRLLVRLGALIVLLCIKKYNRISSGSWFFWNI